MKTWIALLRGINVGGKHSVAMKELVGLLATNGFDKVQTYIQSGNLVFQRPTKPRDEIGLLIEKKFGFKPAVFILGAGDFKKAAANNPYQSEQGKTIHFFFLEAVPETVDYALLDSLKSESEAYQLIDTLFYLYAPDGIGRSKLVEKIGKAFSGVTMTARNLNTINKILEMIP